MIYAPKTNVVTSARKHKTLVGQVEVEGGLAIKFTLWRWACCAAVLTTSVSSALAYRSFVVTDAAMVETNKSEVERQGDSLRVSDAGADEFVAVFANL